MLICTFFNSKETSLYSGFSPCARPDHGQGAAAGEVQGSRGEGEGAVAGQQPAGHRRLLLPRRRRGPADRAAARRAVPSRRAVPRRGHGACRYAHVPDRTSVRPATLCNAPGRLYLAVGATESGLLLRSAPPRCASSRRCSRSRPFPRSLQPHASTARAPALGSQGRASQCQIHCTVCARVAAAAHCSHGWRPGHALRSPPLRSPGP